MTSLRDELEAVRATYGVLNPANGVDAAAKHPSDYPFIHSHLEWDNSVAGPKYRLVQMHELIRSVRVVYKAPTATDPGDDVRAYHAIREPSGSYRYEPAEEVAADPILSELLLRDMEREWSALHRRWGHFQEFVDMVRASLTTV